MNQDTPVTPNTPNTMGEAVVPPTPVTPVVSAEPTAQTGPTAQAEPVAMVAETETVVQTKPVAATTETIESATNNKKKGQWMLPTMIICLVLGLGGVGFGIWALLNSNTRVSELNTEVNSLRSQNEELTVENQALNEEVEELSKDETGGGQWATTEVRDGVFYVLDASGKVIAQSDASGPAVSEVVSCESSSDNTVLKCVVNTTEGEGWFLYDVQGSGLETSFGAE